MSLKHARIRFEDDVHDARAASRTLSEFNVSWYSALVWSGIASMIISCTALTAWSICSLDIGGTAGTATHWLSATGVSWMSKMLKRVGGAAMLSSSQRRSSSALRFLRTGSTVSCLACPRTNSCNSDNAFFSFLERALRAAVVSSSSSSSWRELRLRDRDNSRDTAARW
eukprot:CAMPEP_0174835846 /NCGR_PEP_ID=MMETSP1114-20130205/5647_1 /TAXON_ID=312471 /ORGANISM="Neobodo designis, Strain CCAP 1951/1" /LENGTH=168 /DNA_ID=CAMNT_0016069803 /DNA_START=150 /DNA_END=657 /DNA_ORIENTATION=+